MEDDLKECRNSKCRRHRIMVDRPTSNRCSECGSRLKTASWRSAHDQPALLDLAPDPPKGAKMLTELPHGKANGNGNIVPILFVPPTDRLMSRTEFEAHNYNATSDKYDLWLIYLHANKLQSYQEFPSSDWQAYNKYLKAAGVGPIGDDWPGVVNYNVLRALLGVTSLKDATTPSTALAKVADDTFTCEGPVEGCPLHKKEKEVFIPNIMYRQWIYLCKVFSTEWIAYLKGERIDESWHIESMYFPKQFVEAAHVEVDDSTEVQLQPGTIGTVHSHVAMSAFFSNEDKEHFNHDVEMVLNRAGDIKAVVRTPLECGRITFAEAKVFLEGDATEKELVDLLKAQVVERSRSATSITAGFRTTQHNNTQRHNTHKEHQEEMWRGGGYTGD